MKYLFLVCFLAVAVATANAQTKFVTNDDLTKYRQQRENAERQYRENYAKLGFPSPDELARRQKRSALEIGEYSDELKARNLEIERQMQEQRAAQTRYSPNVYIVAPEPAYSDNGYIYSGGYFLPRQRRIQQQQQYVQPGYFAGGQFWPTGSRTPPPIVIRPHRSH